MQIQSRERARRGGRSLAEVSDWGCPIGVYGRLFSCGAARHPALGSDRSECEPGEYLKALSLEFFYSNTTAPSEESLSQLTHRKALSFSPQLWGKSPEMRSVVLDQ